MKAPIKIAVLILSIPPFFFAYRYVLFGIPTDIERIWIAVLIPFIIAVLAMMKEGLDNI